MTSTILAPFAIQAAWQFVNCLKSSIHRTTRTALIIALFMDESRSCNKMENSNYEHDWFYYPRELDGEKLIVCCWFSALRKQNCCSTVENYNGKSLQFVNPPSTSTSLDLCAMRKVISCFYYAIIIIPSSTSPAVINLTRNCLYLRTRAGIKPCKLLFNLRSNRFAIFPFHFMFEVIFLRDLIAVASNSCLGESLAISRREKGKKWRETFVITKKLIKWTFFFDYIKLQIYITKSQPTTNRKDEDAPQRHRLAACSLVRSEKSTNWELSAREREHRSHVLWHTFSHNKQRNRFLPFSFALTFLCFLFCEEIFFVQSQRLFAALLPSTQILVGMRK